MSRITGGLKEYKILFLLQLEPSILYNLYLSPWCLTHRGLRHLQTLRHFRITSGSFVIGIGKSEPALHNVIHGLTVLLKISLSHVSGFGFVSVFDNEDLKLLAGENAIRQFFLTKNQKFVQFEAAENTEESSDFQRNIEMI